MRSRGVSVSIILQNLAQLKALFEKQWESIVGNCDTFLYLGGNEQSTHKYVSELLGKETIDTNTYGKSEGRSGSYSTNYQISGRELMTPDEVRMLDNRYALLFVRGERPVMDFKYDIMKHPNVRLTTDGGKPPYIHGEPTQAVATLVFDSDIPKNAVSVKAVSTSYELLSNEDLEEIFIPLCLGDHLCGSVRRLDMCRRVYDMLCNQSRAGSKLQHRLVPHDRPDQLIHLFVCRPILSHKAVVTSGIFVPEILVFLHRYHFFQC